MHASASTAAWELPYVAMFSSKENDPSFLQTISPFIHLGTYSCTYLAYLSYFFSICPSRNPSNETLIIKYYVLFSGFPCRRDRPFSPFWALWSPCLAMWPLVNGPEVRWMNPRDAQRRSVRYNVELIFRHPPPPTRGVQKL